MYEVKFKVNKKTRRLLETGDVLLNRHCVIPISLGQAYHEGEGFQAILKKLSETFSEVTIVVADTLQRHNIEFQQGNLSIQNFELQLKIQGKEWVARNIPADWRGTIKYWNSYRKDLNFEEFYGIVQKEYQEDPLFEKAVIAWVNKFLERKFNQRKEFSRNTFDFIKLVHYILEESAVILSWKNTFHFISYPNKMPEPVFYLLKKQGVFQSEFLKFLELDVSHKQEFRINPVSLASNTSLPLCSLKEQSQNEIISSCIKNQIHLNIQSISENISSLLNTLELAEQLGKNYREDPQVFDALNLLFNKVKTYMEFQKKVSQSSTNKNVFEDVFIFNQVRKTEAQSKDPENNSNPNL